MSEMPEPHPSDNLGQTSTRLLRYLPLMALGNVAVAVPTFILSLALAYFTFVQAEATQKMQVAAVWPHVSLGSSNYDRSGQPRISLALGNDGAGPARIAGLRLTYKGEAMPNIRALLLACCSENSATLGYGEERINGEVLRPGESIAFVTLSPEQSGAEVWSKFERERLSVTIEVCYCSVFEECWVRNLDESNAEPVDECPADWTQFNLAPRAPDSMLTPGSN